MTKAKRIANMHIIKRNEDMNEIICPNCSKAFKVDEAGFADIVKQVILIPIRPETVNEERVSM